MNEEEARAAGVPACPEDGLVIAVPTNAWACGPARDDGPWTTATEDCDVLAGSGQFEGGFWDAYECAAFVTTALPDTSVPAPQSGGLGESLAMVVIVGAMVAHAAWRRTKR